MILPGSKWTARLVEYRDGQDEDSVYSGSMCGALQYRQTTIVRSVKEKFLEARSTGRAA